VDGIQHRDNARRSKARNQRQHRAYATYAAAHMDISRRGGMWTSAYSRIASHHSTRIGIVKQTARRA